IPLDVQFERLSARHRRLILHGTGEQWFEVQSKVQGPKSKVKNSLAFRFQFKGLYPAIDEASRLAPSMRLKLEHLVG
ncbi:hypothetical protein, partial [Streptococcus pneumoniae]|uniref:hypothetical protein n=1 Tax=Streptococcus pneumoniae TaxID=1313 RepID=UPI001E498DF7